MKENKTTTRIIQATLLIVGLLIAIPLCLGMYSGITSHTNTSEAIVKTLKEECDCKEIGSNYSAYGLQFSKKDGITTEKASYVLKDCNLASNVSQTMEHVHRILLTEIDGYEKLDVIQFQFEHDGKHDVIEVNNGIIQ